MVRDYAKQETIGSFSAIGKYLAWGLAGSLLLGIGVIFLTLAGLRALQTQTGDTFTGKLTWLPYFIVIAGLAIVGFLVWTIRGKKRPRTRPCAASRSRSA
jgi:hypothetical protein